VTAHEVDVVVLGMGPGGEDAAERLAAAGLSVAGVEARLVGGECPYWGCVPSQMMIRAADLLAEGRRIPGLAGRSQIYPDWAPVAQRVREEATDNWDDKVAVDRFTGKGGTLFRGSARSPRQARSPWAATCSGPGGRSSSTPALTRSCRPSRVWRAPRTGPTGKPSRPLRSRGRWVVLGGGTSARNFPRFLPGSGPGVP